MSKLSRIAHGVIDFGADVALNKIIPSQKLADKLAAGFDSLTDRIFDEDQGAEVPFAEHGDFINLENLVVPFVMNLIESKVLKPFDIPFLDDDLEEDFDKGTAMQIEAMLRQGFRQFFVKQEE